MSKNLTIDLDLLRQQADSDGYIWFGRHTAVPVETLITALEELEIQEESTRGPCDFCKLLRSIGVTKQGARICGTCAREHGKAYLDYRFLGKKQNTPT